jgi:ribosomal protein S27AE
MEGERLFVFELLTAELVYKAYMQAGNVTLSDEQLHYLWGHSVYDIQKQHYEAVARLLNEQLSLCARCGEQAMLHEAGGRLVCQECKMEFQEGARQAERDLYESQITASDFSSEAAYEAWKEEH